MYNAVGDAGQPVSDAIGSIVSQIHKSIGYEEYADNEQVTTLDPPDDSTSPWEYVFSALTFGLSLYVF